MTECDPQRIESHNIKNLLFFQLGREASDLRLTTDREAIMGTHLSS